VAAAGIEMRIPPLVVLALAALIVWFAPVLSGATALDIPMGSALAAGLAAAGLATGIAAVVGFRRAGTTVDPRNPDKTTQLVTGGIYRFTRNPMYVGMALLLSALAVARADTLGFLAVPLFIAFIDRFQIVPEERALRAHFGDAYADWCRRVRRWI
jgi:protein-S-isoprenylcysteine O-methyltransferase Ste14